MSRVGAHLGSDTVHVRMGCGLLRDYVERARIRRQDALLPALMESVVAPGFGDIFESSYFISFLARWDVDHGRGGCVWRQTFYALCVPVRDTAEGAIQNDY